MFPRGDVNGDELVNLADAMLIRQVLQGVRSMSNIAGFMNGDVNFDGATNATDAKMIAQYVAGLRDLPTPPAHTQKLLFYHSDHLGGSNIITDSSGNLVQHVQYSPYGEIDYELNLGVSVNYLFTGQEFDREAGLYYYNARYYDPEIGRFIQPDTIIPYVFDSQSFNRYAYCRNNPVMCVDPSGHQAMIIVNNSGQPINRPENYSEDDNYYDNNWYEHSYYDEDFGYSNEDNGSSEGYSGGTISGGGGDIDFLDDIHQGIGDVIENLCDWFGWGGGGGGNDAEEALAQQTYLAAQQEAAALAAQQAAAMQQLISADIHANTSWATSTFNWTAKNIVGIGQRWVSDAEVGFGESLIPVWGSGRSAILNFSNGQYGWGAVNTLFAVADVFLVKAIITGLVKGSASLLRQGLRAFRRAPKNASSLYDDVTRAGSRYANRATDVTKSQFQKNLVDSGFARTVSKDGKVIILPKDGAKYILRDAAKSTGGATADFYKVGSKSIDLKIRLGE